MGGLAFGFLLTAALYASVGFGGGSTYTAFLTLVGTNFKILPAIALICNIIVVTGGSIRFIRAGEVHWPRVIPLVALSAPLAWLGGLTPIHEVTFKAVLAISLLVAGILLLLQREQGGMDAPERIKTLPGEIAGSAILGYLAGLVGIGGGIFLAPLLHFTRWGKPRAIAAMASLFILINSLFGLAGQLMKGGGLAASIAPYWPLMLAVLVGGQLGSYAALRILSPAWVRKLTAILILYVAGQLLWKLLSAG